MSLTILDRSTEEFHVVELVGDLDLDGAGDVRAHFSDHVSDPAARVVVDLSGVGFMDSTGLGALVGGWQLIRHAGEFRVAGANRTVRRVLEITGMDDVFALFPTVGEATTS